MEKGSTEEGMMKGEEKRKKGCPLYDMENHGT